MMELINENLIQLNLNLNTKEEVIKHLHSLILRDKRIMCPKSLNSLDICQKCEVCGNEGYLDSLFKREEIFPTAVGELYAIPHGKCKFIKVPTVAFARLTNEVLWDEIENEYIKYVFMIGVPDGNNSGNQHIDILVNLSKKIMDDDFRVGINTAQSIEEVLNLINN